MKWSEFALKDGVKGERKNIKNKQNEMWYREAEKRQRKKNLTTDEFAVFEKTSQQWVSLFLN